LGNNNTSTVYKTGTLARCNASPPGILCNHTPTNVALQCGIITTNVVVMFEGWNAPWQSGGGKPISIHSRSTISGLSRKITDRFYKEKYKKSWMLEHYLALEAYSTDTDDDVKTLAIKFIEENHQNNGKNFIYGYSWGGDTAVELAHDLNRKGINVDILLTIDSALGPFNGPAVRDRIISANVKINYNHYTTTPKSRIGSKRLPNAAADPSKTEVRNISYTGPSRGQMDEKTADIGVKTVLDELIGLQICE